MDSRTSRSIKNGVSGITLQLLNIASAFITRKIFLSTLGIENVGLNALFNSVISVLSLSELGIANAMTFALYKPLDNQNWEFVSRIMTLFQKIYRIIAIVIIVSGIAVSSVLPSIVGNTELKRGYIYLTYLLFVIQASTSYLFSYKRVLITADQKEYKVYKVDIAIKYVVVAGSIVVLFIFESLPVYMLFVITTGLLQNKMMSRIVEKEYKAVNFNIKEKLPREYTKKLFEDVKYLFLNKLSGIISSSADTILLSMFSGLVISGKYSNYNIINNYVKSITDIICYSCKPGMGNLIASGDNDRAKKVLRELTFLVFIIICICCNCLLNLSTPFVGLWFGEQYVISINFVITLLIIFYLMTMRNPILITAEVTGIFRVDKNVAIIAMFVNIVSSIVLANKVGFIGIFYGTILAQLIVLFGKIYVFFGQYLKESAANYITYICGLTVVTIITCVVSSTVCSIVILSNKIINFILYGIISVTIPSTLIIVLFYHSNEFKILLERIKGMVDK